MSETMHRKTRQLPSIVKDARGGRSPVPKEVHSKQSGYHPELSHQQRLATEERDILAQERDKRNLRNRIRGWVAIGVLTATAGGALGWVARGEQESAEQHRALPGCEVVVDESGEGIISAATEVGGGATSGEATVLSTGGEIQTMRDIRGNIVVEPGDHVRFEHVGAVACLQAGGAVLNEQNLPAVPTNK